MTGSRPSPQLGAASGNGRLLRLLQGVANEHGWEFRSALNSGEALAMAAEKPMDLMAVDVFLAGKNGLETRSEAHRNPKARETPIVLVAPGCSCVEELGARVEISPSRLNASKVDEAELAAILAELMPRANDSGRSCARLRYGAFLEFIGEACHSANQPLTSLICNLELALLQDMPDAERHRLDACHQSALRIMDIIKTIQIAKRFEAGSHSLPIYLLP